MFHPAPEPKAKTEQAKEPEAKPEAAEVKTEPVEAKGTEPAPAPGKEAQPESVEIEEPEEELAPGVQKKIAKEVARIARADRAIAEAVSRRKEKEAELEKLTTGKPGSEPAPTTAPAATTEPVEPELDEPDVESWQVKNPEGTWAQYQIALKEIRAKHKEAMQKYRADYAKWLKAETTRTVEVEMSERQTQDDNLREVQRAKKEHGINAFETAMTALSENSSEQFQAVLCVLPEWDVVSFHLGNNPAELKRIGDIFADNQVAGLAELGALQYRLKQEAKKPEPEKPPAKAAEKPLPPPPPRPGGSATATGSPFNFAKEPYGKQWKKEMSTRLG